MSKKLSEVRKSGEVLSNLLQTSGRVLIKKLSNNDRDWARFSNKHQAGVYIPFAQRDGGFFPALKVKVRDDPLADEIREAFFETYWPQFDVKKSDTRLVHYTSKGQETHLTRMPKEAFSDLSPASFILIAQPTSAASSYVVITVDSESDDAQLIRHFFDLDMNFEIGEFDCPSAKAAEQDALLGYADQILYAWKSG